MLSTILSVAIATCISPSAGSVSSDDPGLGSVQEEVSDGTEEAPRPGDGGLEDWQAELLVLAHDVASRYPAQPHQKNQARTMERIVVAALDLEQPERALEMIPANPNWRRGAGYAAHAMYCARRGYAEAAHDSIRAAREVIDDPAMLGGQTWRRDRVLSAIAQTYQLLGQVERAAEIERELEIAERGRTLVVALETVDDEDFDGLLGAVRALLDSGTFDQQKNVLLGLAQTFEGFYADESRREALIATVQQSPNWSRLPVTLRVEVLAGLAGATSRAGDLETARELLDQGRALVDERENWPAEAAVPIHSSLARGRALAGQSALAEQNVQAALEAYERGREGIADVFRAETLRPLAEACWDMDQVELSVGLYRRVLDEGSTNPNSWPRGDDLIDTALSMARRGVEPGDELMGEIRRRAEAVFPN